MTTRRSASARSLATGAALLLTGLSLLPQQAAAQTSERHHAVGARIGTSGPGVEYSYSHALYPKYGLRANLNYGSYSRDESWSGIGLRGSVKFESLLLLADAHPYRNGFRLSAGAALNRNRIVANGRPVADTFRINGVTYPATAMESASGELRYQALSPYFGVGWGAAPVGSRRLYFSFDFGVLYQRPELSLSLNCGPALPATECARLQSDLRAQEAKYREDLVKYRAYPILAFGVGYQF
jgi:hypothetical protein